MFELNNIGRLEFSKAIKIEPNKFYSIGKN